MCPYIYLYREYTIAMHFMFVRKFAKKKTINKHTTMCNHNTFSVCVNV